MERLRPFFSRGHGKPRMDDRRVLSGIIFVNRNGLRVSGRCELLPDPWTVFGDI